MPTNTLLTLGCGDCHTCGNPPPPECICPYYNFPTYPDFWEHVTAEISNLPGPCFYGISQVLPGIETQFDWVRSSLFLGDKTDIFCAISAYSTFQSSVAVFTDSDGVGWGVNRVTVAFDFSDDATMEILVIYSYYQLADFGATAALIGRYRPDPIVNCDECWTGFTFDPSDFAAITGDGFTANTPTWPCPNQIITIANSAGCGMDCPSNCCTSLSAGVTGKTYTITGSAVPCESSIVRNAMVALDSTCRWVWQEATPGSPPPDCFTDANGDSWYYLEKYLQIDSTNTAGPEPCTTMRFVMSYVRSSDSASANQTWLFDFAYCDPADIPSTSLALLGTSHDFPNGAPPFRSVTVTPS